MLSNPRPSSPLARMMTPTLELRNRYYAVTDGTNFYYFPLVVETGTSDRPIIRIIKSPPVVLEGYAIINKKIYQVTPDDLLRRVIRKSREVTLESINGTSSTPSISNAEFNEFESDDSYAEESESKLKTLSTILSALHGELQPGFSNLAEVEVGKDVDTTWANQVQTLLRDQDEEEIGFGETWEVEDSA